MDRGTEGSVNVLRDQEWDRAAAGGFAWACAVGQGRFASTARRAARGPQGRQIPDPGPAHEKNTAEISSSPRYHDKT